MDDRMPEFDGPPGGRKRPLDESGGGGGGSGGVGFVAGLRFPDAPVLHFRLLTPLRKAGSVIGKGGDFIQTTKNMTGAKVGVDKPVGNMEERLVHIAGIDEPNKPVAGVQEALVRTAERILGEETPGGPCRLPQRCTLRMLLYRHQVGAVMGKKGAAINEVRSKSGAVVKLTGPTNGLPILPCADPEDELITMSGAPEQTLTALKMLSDRVRAAGGVIGSAVHPDRVLHPADRGGGGPPFGGQGDPKRSRGGPGPDYHGGAGGWDAGPPPNMGPPQHQQHQPQMPQHQQQMPPQQQHQQHQLPPPQHQQHQLPPPQHQQHQPPPQQQHQQQHQQQQAANAITMALPYAARGVLANNDSVKTDGLSGLVTVEYRLLVPLRRSGVILGSKGGVIKEIRNRTGARVHLFDEERDCGDRILQVMSTEGVQDQHCAAFDAAMDCLTALVNDELQNEPVCSARIILPHGQVGAVMGKAGSTIKELRAVSGASIHLSAFPDVPRVVKKGEEVMEMRGQRDSVLLASHVALVAIRGNMARGQLIYNYPPPQGAPPPTPLFGGSGGGGGGGPLPQGLPMGPGPGPEGPYGPPQGAGFGGGGGGGPQYGGGGGGGGPQYGGGGGPPGSGRHIDPRLQQGPPGMGPLDGPQGGPQYIQGGGDGGPAPAARGPSRWDSDGRPPPQQQQQQPGMPLLQQQHDPRMGMAPQGQPQGLMQGPPQMMAGAPPLVGGPQAGGGYQPYGDAGAPPPGGMQPPYGTMQQPPLQQQQPPPQQQQQHMQQPGMPLVQQQQQQHQLYMQQQPPQQQPPQQQPPAVVVYGSQPGQAGYAPQSQQLHMPQALAPQQPPVEYAPVYGQQQPQQQQQQQPGAVTSQPMSLYGAAPGGQGFPPGDQQQHQLVGGVPQALGQPQPQQTAQVAFMYAPAAGAAPQQPGAPSPAAAAPPVLGGAPPSSGPGSTSGYGGLAGLVGAVAAATASAAAAAVPPPPVPKARVLLTQEQVVRLRLDDPAQTKQLSLLSGAAITLSEHTLDNGTREVLLAGSDQQCNTAKNLMEALMRSG